MADEKQDEPRILAADDDVAIRQLICTIMRREGLEADCVADGAEAIEKLKQREYSVILLDLMMPRVDGFGVVDYLRAHPQRTKPIILVISAYADQQFKEVDPNLVAGVIRKPFEVAELGELVRRCVDGYTNEVDERLRNAGSLRGFFDPSWHTPSRQGSGSGSAPN